MSQYYKLCMSVNKRCTNVGRFFSVCILTSRMKRAFQLWNHLKLCTLIAGKYSFVIKIGVVPFTCFLELNNLWEAYVSKHTKVPVMNIEGSFYTLLLSRRWKCASVCNTPRAVVMESVALPSTSQVVIGVRVISLLPSDTFLWILFINFFISEQDWEKVYVYVYIWTYMHRKYLRVAF